MGTQNPNTEEAGCYSGLQQPGLAGFKFDSRHPPDQDCDHVWVWGGAYQATVAGMRAGVQVLVFISLWVVTRATELFKGNLLLGAQLLSALGLVAAATAYWSAPAAALEAQRWFAEQTSTELAVSLARSQVQGLHATAADFLLDAAMEFTATDQAFAVSTAWVIIIVSVLSKLWQLLLCGTAE